MKNITTFEGVRKPIYIAKIMAYDTDFPTAFDAVKAFKERNPEYADCKYDKDFRRGTWIIHLYRECAVDFVKIQLP